MRRAMSRPNTSATAAVVPVASLLIFASGLFGILLSDIHRHRTATTRSVRPEFTSPTDAIGDAAGAARDCQRLARGPIGSCRPG
jgi:hypothetical protein